MLELHLCFPCSNLGWRMGFPLTLLLSLRVDPLSILWLQSLLPLLDQSPIPSHHILHLSIDSISLLLINLATSEDIHRETLISTKLFLRLERFTESFRVIGEPSHGIEERVKVFHPLTIVMTDAGEGVCHWESVFHKHCSHNHSLVDRCSPSWW